MTFSIKGAEGWVLKLLQLPCGETERSRLQLKGDVQTQLNFVDAQLRVGIHSLKFVEMVLGHLDLVWRLMTTKFRPY